MPHNDFKPLEPEYLMTMGKWKVVYQNIETIALFESRIFTFIERPVKIKEIEAPGYRIISAIRQKRNLFELVNAWLQKHSGFYENEKQL